MLSQAADSFAALSESTEAMLRSIADLTDNRARGDRKAPIQFGAWR
jgi:hypothetical protein